MRSSLDHLPLRQQAELHRVSNMLIEGLAERTASRTQPWLRGGKVLKIILFGSYARSDWVDEPENGYQSDFDLLVIVSHTDLTDTAEYWYEAEDRILRDPAIGRLVNIIVHTLDEVNRSLLRGDYFWTDIARDGIVLHDVPGHALATPQPRTPADAYAMANDYFDTWTKQTNSAIKLADFAIAEGEIRDAAFLLHQATERAFTCYLLVSAFYVPRSHNIKFLRSLVEAREPRLIAVWPRVERADRRRFELLKRAYVEARYSQHYSVDRADLDVLAAWVGALRDAVEGLCIEHIDRLALAASGADPGQDVPL